MEIAAPRALVAASAAIIAGVGLALTAPAATAAGAITFDTVRDAPNTAGDALTTQNMLQMQQQLQQWNLLIQQQNTLTMQVGDTLKGVIQTIK